MATAEIPQQNGHVDFRISRRAFIGTGIRTVGTAAVIIPIVRAVESAHEKIGLASTTAASEFPDPLPPTTSPQLRAVAEEENGLIFQRNEVEGTANRIDRSPANEVPPRGDILRGAWEDDKKAK